MSRRESREMMNLLKASQYKPLASFNDNLMNEIGTMNSYLKTQVITKRPIRFEGPHVMSHVKNRGKHTNFMPRIGNHEHTAETNNGYKRKDNGTFFCH